MSKLIGITEEIRDWFFRITAANQDREPGFNKRNTKNTSKYRIFRNDDIPDDVVFKKLFQSIPFIYDPVDKAPEYAEDSAGSISGITVPQGLVTVSSDTQAEQRNDGDTANYSRVVRPSQIVVGSNKTVTDETAFKAIVTVNTPTGVYFLYKNTSDNKAFIYRLEAGTTAESSPDILRPDDYADTTNEKIWVLATVGVSSFTTELGSLPMPEDVGGITAGTTADDLNGQTYDQLFNNLFFPTVLATFTSKSASIAGVAPTGIQEIGTALSFTLTATLNQGVITNAPPTVGTTPLVGAVSAGTSYNFTGNGVAAQPQANNTYVIATNVTDGSQTWGVTITHDAGTTSFTDNKGVSYTGGEFLQGGNANTRDAGTVNISSSSITGIYPYFYGTVTSGTRPTANSALVSGGTKVVTTSSGNITIDWNSGAGDFIWFATPSTSTTKTAWEDTANSANAGAIGGAVSPGGNLFAALDTVSVTTVLWAGVSYKVYISNYQIEQASALILKNS